MPTKRQLGELKQEAAEFLKACEKRVEQAKAVLRSISEAYEAAPDDETDLRTDDTKRTIRSMDVNTHGRSASVKRGAGRATRKHPAQKRLYERGKTITDIAAELKEGRPRVSSWFAEGDAQRPIPRHHAEYLRDKYGIPINVWRVAG